MMDYLVFRLYGPIVSWGEIAVGEARHTASYPGKSAICGLLAAALGVSRNEEAVHQSLAYGYCQAVKMIRAGHLLKDFHTIQAPDSVGKFRYRSRRDELVVGRDRLGTALSSREYRCDALSIVALRVQEGAPYSLIELKEALMFPKFHLYLGRKSCPLAAPLHPELIESDGFRQALDSYQPGELLVNPRHSGTDYSRWLPEDELIHYYWEGRLDYFSVSDGHFSSEQVQQLVSHDFPSSRRRWQFETRKEYLWLDDRRAE